MTMRSGVAGLIIASLSLTGVRAGDILNIGDAAPPVTVGRWIQGEPVERFEPGQTYVVWFWATWSPHCRPHAAHLTDLAHRYRDKKVRIVGVDVWEQDTGFVEPFVAALGAKMECAVALDRIPEGSDPKAGAMARGWLAAAVEEHLPIAFVVQAGKIAWIGSPINIDEPLDQIVAGTWTSDDLAVLRLQEKTKERRTLIQQNVVRSFQTRDYQATLTAIDEAAAIDPKSAAQFASMKFAALCNSGEVRAGLKLGNQLFEANQNNASSLNMIFWNVVDPDVVKQVDPRIGLPAARAARRAVELATEDYGIRDTLAEALFCAGDPVAALATEEEALELLEAQIKDHSHIMFKTFAASIERFRVAAEAKAARH